MEKRQLTGIGRHIPDLRSPAEKRGTKENTAAREHSLQRRTGLSLFWPPFAKLKKKEKKAESLGLMR